MATTLVAPLVQIVNRRATCTGVQYGVTDVLGQHTVTINEGHVSCTCGLDCAPCHVAIAQEQSYTVEALQRETYCSTFSIY